MELSICVCFISFTVTQQLLLSVLTKGYKGSTTFCVFCSLLYTAYCCVTFHLCNCTVVWCFLVSLLFLLSLSAGFSTSDAAESGPVAADWLLPSSTPTASIIMIIVSTNLLGHITIISPIVITISSIISPIIITIYLYLIPVLCYALSPPCCPPLSLSLSPPLCLYLSISLSTQPPHTLQ